MKVRHASVITAACMILASVSAVYAGNLHRSFVSPPRSSAPQTWWHWMNGNVTKDGISADLEAMAWAGLSGAHIFDVDCDIPAGPVKFGSGEWFDMILHAHNEAKRLGLSLCVANCSGFSSSGGPWVKPEDSMKKIVFSETRFRGPGRISLPLEQPPVKEGFYRDICVIAVPAGKEEEFPELQPGVETSERVLGNLYVKDFSLPESSDVSQLQLRFTGPLVSWTNDVHVRVRVSDDRIGYRTVLDIPRHSLRVGRQGELAMRHLPFKEKVSAKYFRVTVDFRGLEKKGFAVAESHLGRLCRIPAVVINELGLFARKGRDVVERLPDSEEYVVESYKTINVTEFFKNGRLSCSLPDGDWQIFRFGYTSTGIRNHPASAHGIGLECDKFSAAATGRFFDGYLGRLVGHLGISGYSPTGVNAVLIDSYEVGCQNWTEAFDREFSARCGYDIAPFMPFFAGKVISSHERTDEFLRDFRRVASELFAENYSGEMKRRCHEAGLALAIEPYGCHPGDDQLYGANADEPMWEFWCADKSELMYTDTREVYPVASIAHVFGRRCVAAESFTSSSAARGWTHTPWTYKGRGDEAFAAGINKIVYHRWAHQPWTDPPCLPGMTMGPWGTCFERTQTWWPYVRPWIRYQTRCQQLLQEGEIARDVLFFSGSSSPNNAKFTSSCDSPADILVELQDYYGIDSVSSSIIESFSMKEGRLTAPSGVSYKALLFRPEQYRSPAHIRLLRKWRAAGLPVIAADGGVDEARRSLEEAGVRPDFMAPEGIRHIHRRYQDGSEGYFVAWPGDKPLSAVCSFRVSGREAELWDPETGEAFKADVVSCKNGRTDVRISFPARGSYFVMFRPQPTEGVKERIETKELSRAALPGPWKVHFPLGWYDGSDREETLTLDRLVDWTAFADGNIRFFSGSAVYETSFKCKVNEGERVVLHLGDVRNIAEVTVNSRTYDALWRLPFELDITDGISPDGSVKLKVKVANLWVNRLIGDEAVEGGIKWKKTFYGEAAAELPPLSGAPGLGRRHTFTTWRHWRKDDRTSPSGLLGPVEFSVRSRQSR